MPIVNLGQIFIMGIIRQCLTEILELFGFLLPVRSNKVKTILIIDDNEAMLTVYGIR